MTGTVRTVTDQTFSLSLVVFYVCLDDVGKNVISVKVCVVARSVVCADSRLRAAMAVAAVSVLVVSTVPVSVLIAVCVYAIRCVH